MPWAVCTSPLPVFREDEPPMSLVASNGAFLSRKGVGRQTYRRASLAGIGRFCSRLWSEPVQPRKADGGSQSLLVYRTSRFAAPHPEAACFFSEP